MARTHPRDERNARYPPLLDQGLRGIDDEVPINAWEPGKPQGLSFA